MGDEPILRDLRLQAIADAPEAFESTRERELARTTADWQRMPSSQPSSRGQQRNTREP